MSAIKYVERHSKLAILMHWVNAICYFILLGTGFALLQNDTMRPMGDWWAQLWSDTPLLDFHIIVALVWIAFFAVAIILGIKSVSVPFLREIFRLSPVQDFIWCVRKGLWLILSEKTMRKLGLNPELPPQGFYNAGQKYVAILIVFCSLALVVTGAILLQSRGLDNMENIVQYSLFIHLVSAGLVAIALPVHIYMAAAAPTEKPAFISMLTGKIPLEHVRHHNPLWYKALEAEERAN